MPRPRPAAADVEALSADTGAGEIVDTDGDEVSSSPDADDLETPADHEIHDPMIEPLTEDNVAMLECGRDVESEIEDEAVDAEDGTAAG